MNKKKLGICLAAVLIMVVVAWGIYSAAKDKADKSGKTAVADQEPDNEESDVITYNGKKYRYNTDLKTVLFLGVDKTQEAKVNSTPGYNGQTDTIILYILDRNAKTAKRLAVSRDTMTEIALYDQSGEFLATEKAQIALQYAYGDGDKKSCRLVSEAVSKLLYGVPIRNYISVSVDGIKPIVDAMGGVSLTVPQDYTYINPAFQQGAQIVLDGAQAESYVRYRDTSVSGSNTERMERQMQFISAMFEQLKAQASSDLGGYGKLLDSAGEYMVTSMTMDELKEMSEYDLDSEIINVPGEMTGGAEHDEFLVNNDKLNEIILNLFYKIED